MITELSKRTAIAFRDFVATPAYREGRDYLIKMHSPKAEGSGDAQLLKWASEWKAYHQVFEDIENVLTHLPVREKPIEGPSMEEIRSD